MTHQDKAVIARKLQDFIVIQILSCCGNCAPLFLSDVYERIDDVRKSFEIHKSTEAPILST